MSQLIREGKAPKPPHTCVLPGKRKEFTFDHSLTDVNPGAIARCDCGKLWRAEERFGEVEWYTAGPLTMLRYIGKGRKVQP